MESVLPHGEHELVVACTKPYHVTRRLPSSCRCRPEVPDVMMAATGGPWGRHEGVGVRHEGVDGDVTRRPTGEHGLRRQQKVGCKVLLPQ